MDINPKYKDTNLNQQAVGFLPEIVIFFGPIASTDNRTYTNEDCGVFVTKMADQAAN